MSDETKIALRDVRRADARELVVIGPAGVNAIADRLDELSMQSTGRTYFFSAEQLRMLAEQTEENREHSDARLLAAIQYAADWENRYNSLRLAYDQECDKTADQRKILADRADTIARQARELTNLIDKLTREEQRSAALARVLGDTIAELAGHEDVEIVFVYGENNGGIEPEVASDLGVGATA